MSSLLCTCAHFEGQAWSTGGGGKLRSVLVVRCGCRQMWTLVALTTVVVCSGADNDAARLVASGGNAVVNEKVVTAVLLI